MLILLIADVVVITNDSMSLFLLFKYFTIVGIVRYKSVFAAAVWYDITIVDVVVLSDAMLGLLLLFLPKVFDDVIDVTVFNVANVTNANISDAETLASRTYLRVSIQNLCFHWNGRLSFG